MNQPVAPTFQTLTPEQLQGALPLFFDLLPEPAWEGGKPSAADLVAWLDEAQDFLPAETLTIIDALQAPGHVALRAEAAQSLLRGFQANEALRPYVDHALYRASREVRAVAPSVGGALIAALSVLPPVEWKVKGVQQKLRIRWKPTERAARLAGGIAILARSLPARALEQAIQSVDIPPAPEWLGPDNLLSVATVNV